MNRLLGSVTTLLLIVVFAPSLRAQEIECVEECVSLHPGFGCRPGSQGDNCTAGSYYCMIDNCEQIPGGGGGPEVIRAADGRLYYAVIPCQSPAIVVPAHTAVVVTERPATQQALERRSRGQEVRSRSSESRPER